MASAVVLPARRGPPRDLTCSDPASVRATQLGDSLGAVMARTPDEHLKNTREFISQSLDRPTEHKVATGTSENSHPCPTWSGLRIGLRG